MAWTKEAQKMIEEIADDKVGSFKSDLDTVVRMYCTDPKLVENGVNSFLDDLPHHKAPHIDGFIAWKMLMNTADVLKKHAKEAKLPLEHKDPIAHESNKPDGKTPTVDDKGIRESAGLDNDADVADSSLTEKAKEHRITNDDIGKSSRDDTFVYEDQIHNVPDPATCYRKATRFLFSAIIGACLGDPQAKRLEVLLQNNVITSNQI